MSQTDHLSHAPSRTPDEPRFRYTAELAGQIELAWQDRWESEGTFHATNPTGDLGGPRPADAEKFYVLDMFPYPSGAGLHVGHPLGYIATDVVGRYKRMQGANVLHALAYDAFGLPAEQYAVQTGQHPRVTTEANIATMRRQLRRLGLAHDPRRSFATIDPDYVRWTQWIFLQIFNSWYDPEAARRDGGRGSARPIAELEAEYDAGTRPTPDGRPWADLTAAERADVINVYRLAYVSDAPVNWCPGLGTVLANEEVTVDGRSERGNFPVFQRNLRQWKMRITAYADRLIDDLESIDWPDKVKAMQRNWIGRSDGARVHFAVPTADGASTETLTVFTTRPDTLFGATFMVLSPEHPLLERIVPAAWPEGTKAGVDGRGGGAVVGHRRLPGRGRCEDRGGAAGGGPGEDRRVHGHLRDQPGERSGHPGVRGRLRAHGLRHGRDHGGARRGRARLGVRRGVRPADRPHGAAAGRLRGRGVDRCGRQRSTRPTTRSRSTAWTCPRPRPRSRPGWPPRVWASPRRRTACATGCSAASGTGVSRSRSSTTPTTAPSRCPRARCRWSCPTSRTTRHAPTTPTTPPPPRSRRCRACPSGWTSRSTWATGPGCTAATPTPCRTGRAPAGTNCATWTRTTRLRSSTRRPRSYWMGPQGSAPLGGADLYVGGVEHAVLHLLYARFWHKVLYDLGHVSSAEPFHRLFNQGYIQAYAFADARGQYVPAAEVEEREGDDGAVRYFWEGTEVIREYGKMGKSLKNVVTPDDMYTAYGADTFRVYEMSMGPLDVSRPWETRAVVGSQRFLQRLWRNVVYEETGEVTVVDDAADLATRRLVARTIADVTVEMDAMRLNTAIAKLIVLNNHLTSLPAVPREGVEPLVLMLAPIAPHIAEELWSRLGHEGSLAYEGFPTADPALLVEDTVTCIVQVAGKVRDRLEVAPSIGADELRDLALATAGVTRALEGRGVRTVIVKAPRLVNVVPA